MLNVVISLYIFELNYMYSLGVYILKVMVYFSLPLKAEFFFNKVLVIVTIGMS